MWCCIWQSMLCSSSHSSGFLKPSICILCVYNWAGTPIHRERERGRVCLANWLVHRRAVENQRTEILNYKIWSIIQLSLGSIPWAGRPSWFPTYHQHPVAGLFCSKLLRTFMTILSSMISSSQADQLPLTCLVKHECWAKTNSFGDQFFFREGNHVLLCNSFSKQLVFVYQFSESPGFFVSESCGLNRGFPGLGAVWHIHQRQLVCCTLRRAAVGQAQKLERRGLLRLGAHHLKHLFVLATDYHTCHNYLISRFSEKQDMYSWRMYIYIYIRTTYILTNHVHISFIRSSFA